MGESERNDRLYTVLLTHDISNFNQTTRGYLEMLLAEQLGKLTDEQNRVLTTCLRQCVRVKNVIDAVRLLQELDETGPRLEPVDMDRAVREAIQSVQDEQTDRDVRVRFTAGGRRVSAEPQLTELFRQLIGNAARHNDCEVVEVELTFAERDDGMWEIKVSDNGNGVPPAKREALFTRLEDGEVHGAGVGLSLARALVRRWSGDIRLEDTPPGDGAVFTVLLPRA